MNPVVAPIFLIPLGRRVLIESEVEVESDLTYSHGEYRPVTLTKSVEYAQLDFFASKYLTIVAGRYATPFNIYKERFDARWIRNLSAAPLIFPLGTAPATGASCGAPYSQFLRAVQLRRLFFGPDDNVSASSARQSGLRTALFFQERDRSGLLLQPLAGRESLQQVRD